MAEVHNAPTSLCTFVLAHLLPLVKAVRCARQQLCAFQQRLPATCGRNSSSAAASSKVLR